MKLASWPIEQLPGLTSDIQQRLLQLDIQTTADLLRRSRTQSQRLALAEQLGSHLQYINKWRALAQLAALPSVGLGHCGLLLHAGVGSLQQLATVRVDRLHQQLQRLQIRLMSQLNDCPGPALIAQWVQEAQTAQSRLSRGTKTSL